MKPSDRNDKRQIEDIKSLRVALVCDWLTGYGGAEKVVLELHRIFPSAPIYTSQYKPSSIDWFDDADVRTGWLQSIPVGLKKFLPILRAWYFSRLDLSDYDLVISETGAEAKAIKFGDKATHVCICNTPTHYYWSRYEQYIAQPGFPRGFNWLAKIGLKILVKPLRTWDRRVAQRPSQLIAISSHIQNEIKKYYNRDSEVIYPPVDISKFAEGVSLKKEDYFVITGRHTPYKRFDLAIKACNELGLKLKVVGDGPEHEALRRIASETIEFTGQVSGGKLIEIVARAKGFIFPGLDDFGIAPVEALSAGVPVIAYKAGGALDYVKDGQNGVFFDAQTVESLTKALRGFNGLSFNPVSVAKTAEKFSVETFEQDLLKLIEEKT